MSRKEFWSRKEIDLKWAEIWFDSLSKFRKVEEPQVWQFELNDVVAFLRASLAEQMPTWKRIKVLDALIVYRDRVRKVSEPRLEVLRIKLLETLQQEKLAKQAVPIADIVGVINPREPDIIQEFRRKLRLEGKQYSTEKAYVGKVRAFMADRGLRCLADFDDIDGKDVESHLTDLAVDGNIAASTQNQAFSALLFLFKFVLKRDAGRINAYRSSKAPRVPTVMSVAEVVRLLKCLSGIYLLIAELLYGCGMRLGECLRLRPKDIDFELKRIEVHNAKGNKSRYVPLPEKLIKQMHQLIASRRVLHEGDLESGMASVWLPDALDRKWPNAHREFKWQFLFCSARFSKDPRTGKFHRHHLDKGTFPDNLKRAVREAGFDKHVTSHTFRHSFATHMMHAGTDIRKIQELLGHSDINTTAIYLHVLNSEDSQVISPLDRLQPTSTAEEAREACTPTGSKQVCAKPVPQESSPAVTSDCDSEPVADTQQAAARSPVGRWARISASFLRTMMR